VKGNFLPSSKGAWGSWRNPKLKEEEGGEVKTRMKALKVL